MGDSKVLEVPQVRDALWFDPAQLLLSLLALWWHIGLHTCWCQVNA